MPELQKTVLLINPKAFPGQKPTKGMAFFPFSIVYIVNHLRRIDLCEVDYVDLVMEDEEALLKHLSQHPPDLLGVTCLAANRFIAINLARRLKAAAPKAKIVVGGQFFGYYPQETLQNVPEIDFVVRGDGEYTTEELVRALDGHMPLSDVKGLSWRDGEHIVHNEKRRAEMHFERFYVDLERITKPGYDILQPMANLEERQDIKALPMLISKGCINNCVYCINQNEPFRGMQLDFLIEKIAELKEQYKTKYFLFTDPSFGSRPGFVRELCNALIEHKLNIQWYCELRPDIGLDLLELMAKAGCISIHFAVESGSETIMKLMRRRTSLKQVLEFSRACNRLGITYGYFTLISFPGETLRECWDTLRLVEMMAYEGGFTGMSPLFVVPSTDLETMAKERGVIPSDFDWFDESYTCTMSHVASPVVATLPHYLEHLTSKQITKIAGLSLALQDFIHGNKRVRNLRWRFLPTTYLFVFGSFWRAFSLWKEPKKKLDVLRMAGKMLGWFLLWKLKKPFIDRQERMMKAKAAPNVG